MANKKISELPSATTPLDDTDLFEVVQGGINKKVAKSDVSSGGGTWGSIGGTLSDQTDLQTALDAKQTSGQVSSAITAATVGVQDLFIPAAAMWPRVTNGCSPLAQVEFATSLINAQTLDFNQTTQQYAQVCILLPRKYNLSTITYQIVWSATTGTGSVVWSLAGVALSDGDAFTTTFGTAVTVTDAAGTANTRRLTTTSSAVTLGNTPADADGIYLEVSRVTGDGSDDMAADAKLIGVWVHITTDAAIDA